VNSYTGVEDKTVRAAALAPGLSIAAIPSPFNFSTRIQVSGKLIESGAHPFLRIYTLDGVLVKDFSVDVAGTDRSVLFAPDRNASNVYLVKCGAGDKVITKKIILLK
jgi:hypothetical protein